VRHRPVGVDQLEHRTGDECAENRLEPELLSEDDERSQQDEGTAHADLRGRVLQPDERGREAQRALRLRDGDPDCRDERDESAEQDELRAEPARLA